MNVFDYPEDELRMMAANAFLRLSQACDTADAAGILSEFLRKYTIFDLQTIGANIRFEVQKLPKAYRDRYERYALDLIDNYHRFVSSYRRIQSVPIQDLQQWAEYWTIGESAVFGEKPAGSQDPRPELQHPAGKLFYRLIYGYVMLIDGRPGHPVGMPFPGGLTVREDSGIVYCPIRDKEKDLPQALCNYCPALQDPQHT